MMTITKREPINEERRAALRRDPDVVYRERTEDPTRSFISEIRVTGDIDTLALLGRCDDEEDNDRSNESFGVVKAQ